MKKVIAFLGLGLAVLSVARADNRLFATDVLNKNEFDVDFTAIHSASSGAFDNGTGAVHQSSDMTLEALDLRYGLGGNWQIGLSQAYISREAVRTDGDGPFVQNTTNEIRLDPGLSVKYKFIGDNSGPLSMSAHLQVNPNTEGVHTTYGAGLAAGWKSSDTLRLYGIWSTTFKKDGYPASNTLGAGVEKDLSDGVTLVPHIDFNRVNASAHNDVSSQSSYHAGLNARVRLSGNSYLLPTIAYDHSSRIDYVFGFHVDPGHGFAEGLAFYHLF